MSGRRVRTRTIAEVDRIVHVDKNFQFSHEPGDTPADRAPHAGRHDRFVTSLKNSFKRREHLGQDLLNGLPIKAREFKLDYALGKCLISLRNVSRDRRRGQRHRMSAPGNGYAAPCGLRRRRCASSVETSVIGSAGNSIRR